MCLHLLVSFIRGVGGEATSTPKWFLLSLIKVTLFAKKWNLDMHIPDLDHFGPFRAIYLAVNFDTIYFTSFHTICIFLVNPNQNSLCFT